MTAISTPEAPMTSIDALLDKTDELAALPQVVMRVIDLTADPRTTATDLERAAGMDQAFAAKVLALANSSYYGLPRRISTLREAVVFLGFKTVRNLAMTITTFNLFLGKSDSLSLARRAIWRHSLDTAQCARTIHSRLHPADQESFSGEEAFTAGLLHDIGKLVIDHTLPAQFARILEKAKEQGARFYEVEMEVLPYSHSLVGAALAQRWNLPPALCETIAFHHTPRAAETNPKLTSAVSLADAIAHHLAGDNDFEQLAARSAEAMIPLRLTSDTVQLITGACRAEVENGLSQLSLG